MIIIIKKYPDIQEYMPEAKEQKNRKCRFRRTMSEKVFVEFLSRRKCYYTDTLRILISVLPT